MSPLLKAATALSTLAVAVSLPCLVKTTAGTMTLLFFVGIPAYAAGALLYGVELYRFVRSHWV